VVLHVDTEKAKSWTEREVVTRWHQLFKGNMLSQRYINNDNLAKAELAVLRNNIKEWHSRLCDISWFPDYSRLPNPVTVVKQNSTMPSSKEQILLTDIWSAELGITVDDIDICFFNMGGDSLPRPSSYK